MIAKVEPKYLTPGDAAEYVGYSPNTLARYRSLSVGIIRAGFPLFQCVAAGPQRFTVASRGEMGTTMAGRGGGCLRIGPGQRNAGGVQPRTNWPIARPCRITW